MAYISLTDLQAYIDAAELTALFTDSGTYNSAAVAQVAEAATDTIKTAIRNAGYTVPSSTLVGLGTVSLNAAGTGYTNGDVLTLVQAGASDGTVTATAAAGLVSSGAILARGRGYAVATGLATSGGTGTGCKFNIVAVSADVSEFIKMACVALFREMGCQRKFLKLPEDWRYSPMYRAMKDILSGDAELDLAYSTADTVGGVIGPITDTSNEDAQPRIFGRRNLSGL
jgi:hypothetical protein